MTAFERVCDWQVFSSHNPDGHVVWGCAHCEKSVATAGRHPLRFGDNIDSSCSPGHEPRPNPVTVLGDPAEGLFGYADRGAGWDLAYGLDGAGFGILMALTDGWGAGPTLERFGIAHESLAGFRGGVWPPGRVPWIRRRDWDGHGIVIVASVTADGDVLVSLPAMGNAARALFGPLWPGRVGASPQASGTWNG